MNNVKHELPTIGLLQAKNDTHHMKKYLLLVFISLALGKFWFSQDHSVSAGFSFLSQTRNNLKLSGNETPILWVLQL